MKCQRYRLFTITIIFHRLEACADIDVKFINLSDFDMTRLAISIREAPVNCAVFSRSLSTEKSFVCASLPPHPLAYRSTNAQNFICSSPILINKCIYVGSAGEYFMPLCFEFEI